MIDYLIIIPPLVLVAFIVRWRDLRRISALEERAVGWDDILFEVHAECADLNVGLQHEAELRQARVSHLNQEIAALDDAIDHLSDNLRRLERGKP